MNNTKITIVFLLSLSILILSGCKKYEEGPWLSLKTKKARITGEWELDYSFHKNNGVIIGEYDKSTNPSVGRIIKFEEDGVYTITITKPSEVGIHISRWAFIDGKGGKEYLRLEWRTYKIIRLTNKELIYTDYYSAVTSGNVSNPQTVIIEDRFEFSKID